MRLPEVVLARAALLTRPSWYAIFAKAYAIVSARRPELRRSYMALPWARLSEHARNFATTAMVDRTSGEVDYSPPPSTKQLQAHR
jgi:hypothetical protein